MLGSVQAICFETSHLLRLRWRHVDVIAALWKSSVRSVESGWLHTQLQQLDTRLEVFYHGHGGKWEQMLFRPSAQSAVMHEVFFYVIVLCKNSTDQRLR